MFTDKTLDEIFNNLKENGYKGDKNDVLDLLLDTEFKSNVDLYFNHMLKNKQNINTNFVNKFISFLLKSQEKFDDSTFQTINNQCANIIFYNKPRYKNNDIENEYRNNFDIVIQAEREGPFKSNTLYSVRFYLNKNGKELFRKYKIDLSNGNIERSL